MFGQGWSHGQLDLMVSAQRHRGPDSAGVYVSPSGVAGLGHNRLSIIDLSDASRQPMSDPSGRYWMIFNGEIYNYLELRAELEDDFPFRSDGDSEVLLAAYLKWGDRCLNRLIGMFAFIVWDDQEHRLFGARDRFGVKPLHLYTPPGGGLWLASEIKALHAAGVPRHPDSTTWATYLTSGMHDHAERTCWEGISRVAPGGSFSWSATDGLRQAQWYDIADEVLRIGPDERADKLVMEELLSLLDETTRLRFRADVPVGICLSGGLDSSLLLALVHRVQGRDSSAKAFTFYCGDSAYDEIPWVEQALAGTRHPACFCRLTYEEVPALAARVQYSQDEPFGGLPTLGMAKVHERAVQERVTVLLDGNGLDEGWAGYDYYQNAASVDASIAPVQGSQDPSTKPECLAPSFASLAARPAFRKLAAGALASLQYRDIRFAKIPRAMRFADRVSMLSSRELREPFLDHRIVELGLRQPCQRKLRNGHGKHLVRRVAEQILPHGVREAPKRALQTPQREWLRGPLRPWATDCIDLALAGPAGDWFRPQTVRAEWARYCSSASDNSFFVWQWISVGLLLGAGSTPTSLS